ncbi:MAG: phosphoribosyltransferase [Chitinophagaceae bacterium]|nr:phosphoribosyltransferase [Chitinophagaceae bacterium]
MLFNKEVAEKKLHRMSLEIAEQLTGDQSPLVILGIEKNGVVIAKKIASFLQPYLKMPARLANISLNKQKPGEVKINADIDFNGVNIIITDDVTNSGRTLLYACKPLLSYHPKSIRTLVLVERMHRHFSMRPDFVGLSVATTLQDHIQVEVEEEDISGAYLL